MMATIRLLEYLAHRQQTDQRRCSGIAHFPPALEKSVECPAEDKGMVMRKLNERFANAHVDKTDGMKIWLENGEWIHFAPDPERPVCNVTAEAACHERAQQLVEECTEDVREMLLAES